MSADNVLAILAIALVTYLPRTGHVKQAMDALPATVLTAVIAPAVTAGKAEMIAGTVTVLAATRLPIIATLAIDMASVVLLRAFA